MTTLVTSTFEHPGEETGSLSSSPSIYLGKCHAKHNTGPQRTQPCSVCRERQTATLLDDQCKAWFEQAEAQFALRNIILEETRYFYVIGALGTAVCLSLLLPVLPSCYNYTKLKNLQIQTYGLSDDEQACIFLNICELGDHCPSQVMDEILCLHSSEDPNFMLLFAFKQLLPAPVRCPGSISFHQALAVGQGGKTPHG